MSIGLTANTSPAQLNATVGNYAIQLRNLFANLEQFIQWFDTLALSDIETQFGLSPADAATLQAIVGNMSTLANVYNGVAIQLTLPFDFGADTAPLWGGQ